MIYSQWYRLPIEENDGHRYPKYYDSVLILGSGGFEINDSFIWKIQADETLHTQLQQLDDIETIYDLDLIQLFEKKFNLSLTFKDIDEKFKFGSE